jgi:tight adherence protein C
MTPSVLLAAAAGACAAAAIAELAGAPRRPRAPLAAGGHLAAIALIVARVARRTRPRAPRRDLVGRLTAAGAPLGLTSADVVALEGAGALAGVLLALPLATELPGRLGVAFVLCAGAGGYLAPDVVLARRARARADRIRRELGDVLELLRVAVEAGLPAGRALGEVGRRCRGLLAAELGAASARMQLGATRAGALGELTARCPVEGVGALAAAILRADRHGVPLAPALAALAVEARAEQARRVRDGAARAAPKIQLVVALVLVPAVMLLVAAVLLRTVAGPR